MPVFACRVADDTGKIEEFFREAASEEPLLRELASRRLSVVSVEELERGGAAARTGRRFSRRVVGELTDLLSLMLASGLSLKDSLEVAQTVSDRGAGLDLVTLLLEKIRKGGSFSAALEAAGGSFSPVYRGMVRIGERIGSLDQVLSRLSSFLGDEKKLRARFGAALLYPAVVLGVAVVSAVLMAAVLFPRMREIFSQLGPGMAGRVESLMSSLTSSFVVLGVLFLTGIAVCVVLVHERGKGGSRAVQIDARLLKVPLIGSFLMQRELLSFTFAMETLTASGVSVEEALSEGAEAVANWALRGEILEIREKILKGGRLSAAFAQSSFFPARIARWVGTGERVGRVEKVFAQLRAYHQQEVEKWINRLMTLIEPAFIVVLGIMIILFVVFFIVPIFSLYGNIL